MSRLDEALRRSVSSVGSPLPQSRQGDVFASPWSVGADAAVAEADPVKRNDDRPSSGSRLMVSAPTNTLGPNWKEWHSSPGIDATVVEQFRKLAAALFHAQREGRLKVIMVTSAVPGEGKTMTALNLARVLSESYRRSVLLIDADLRRPRLTEAAGLTTADGLAAALKSTDLRKISVTQLTERLTLLPAGRPDPEPLSGLTSPRMQQLIEEGAERFDWVIVDTPPVGVATDAGLLGAMVDATVLVVKSGDTPLHAVRHAVDTLGRDRIFGVVLNGVDAQAISTYGEYAATPTPDEERMNLLFGRLRAHLLTGRTVVLIFSEFVLIVLSIIAAAAIRMTPTGLMQVMGMGLIWRASLIAGVLQVCLHFCDLYDLRTLSDRRVTVTALLRALGAVSLCLALLYYWVPSLIIGRGVFAIASLLIIALIAGWRIAFNWLSLRLEPAERLLIVGTNAAAVALARELFERRQELAVELVGFVDPDPSKVGMSLLNPGVIGTVSDIPQIVRDRRADRVVVSLADARGKLSMDELLRMKLQEGVRFDHLASVYEEYTGKIAVENLRPSWLIFSEGFRRQNAVATLKRFLDVVIAALGLLVCVPVLVVAAVAIKLTSDGPALYSQARVGRNGRLFTVYKLRSMRQDAEVGTGAVWSTVGDPRVTRLGRLLRRTRLDELPQLWNVLRGDMSMVGPRPERPEFINDLTQQIPYYGQRHAVRPGVTGWAQVRHNYGASVDDALQKLQYDLFYIKHMSITFDLFVILETIKTVLVRRGS